MRILLFVLMSTTALYAADLPRGYWTRAQATALLDKTQTVRLAPDLSSLTAGEKEAVTRLLEVGEIMQTIYEDARHPEALTAAAELERAHLAAPSDHTSALLSLYRLFSGPIASTLDNRREPFLPVSPQTPTRNVYPQGATKAEIDAWLEKHPEERATILGERTVVRRANGAGIARDLRTLERYPVLDTLHPGLKETLLAHQKAPVQGSFYAVPQSVAWPEETIRMHGLLNDAATAVEGDDPEFARYLRNRSRDLLSDDYESGDAAWVTGKFRALNAQIGSYETYDDPLYGVKAFHSLSLLIENREESLRLRSAIGELQEFEDALPYERQKRVRSDIPVGVYDVIADFGQSRGANTATILPNDPLFSARYGRVILLRQNIMRHPAIFENGRRGFDAVLEPSFHTALTSEGDFHRTLWHEIGHYLGVDRDINGRTLDVALEENADAFEEMKADLVSLFLAPRLRARDYFDDAALRSVYASGIRRVLQNARPRRDQPYQTMQLMQLNWFLDKGVLTLDERSGRLSVDFARYPAAVESLLKEVLAIQSAGDKARSDRFIDRWTTWDSRHEALARRITESQRYRFNLMRYAALGE